MPGLGISPDTSDAAENAVFTEDVKVTAVITATWTHGTGQTDANDPAPASIWLIETSGASWSAEGKGNGTAVAGTGSADDGLSNPSDPPVATYDNNNGLKIGEVVASVNAPPQTAPPAHWFTQSISGGSFSFTRTFTAHTVGKLPANASGGLITTVCSFNGYTVSVHAQPYNFHQTSGTDNLDGTISFTYGWQSTSGSIADLTTCYLHERVTYPGANGTYVAPVPFTQLVGYPNPTVAPGTGNAGIAMTSTSTNQDIHHLWGTSSNYSDFTSVTISAAQRYEFDDVGSGSNLGTGEVNVLIPGSDSTPTITRTIYPVGSPPNLPDWWYSVTKNGVTATKKVISHP